jgi:NTP pyrophosphatase (non-canonical NTP hydrolase)
MKSLTFAKLRKVNVARCEKHFHKLDDWSESDWACALAGEVGEFCNFIKKRRRAQDDLFIKYSGKKAPKGKFKEDCKKEIGDIIAYLDLNAAKLGLTLEECIRDKFNEVSKRVKAKHRL